ncbi:MAG TPA: efflux RND transporter periplasmic adaptor subunit [Verrucomicrobiae bacterium]|jgi:RND family efflux transporter MFP subunit
MSSAKPSLNDLRIDRGPEQARSSGASWGKYVVVLLVVIGLAMGTAVFLKGRTEVVEVQTVLARQTGGGSADRTVLNATGYVTARRKATVSAKTTGKVIDVLIEEGMKVKDGQVLARLDDLNVKTGLDVAQAQLESTKLSLGETRAQLKQADREFLRVSNLANINLSSASDLDKAESDAMMLRARLARQEVDITAAERTVAQWNQQMDDMVIRAPFDGVVTTKDAQPGEMISPVSAGGGFTRTGICTVVDMNSLEIELDVNESYINRVEAGQPAEATLDAYPDWKIPCKVIAIIPTADRQKSTVKVRVGFLKLDPRILPDMSVKVAFQEAVSASAIPVSAVIIPKAALQSQDGRDIVFIFQNGHAERRAVSIRITQGDYAVLSAGVSAGEKVIAEPPPGLKDGAAVKEKTHE